MPKKTFIGDLFLNEDYADRKEELERIRSGIRDKLISRGVQFTENLDEADFVIVFVTRCFLPRSSNILSRICVEGVQHVTIICDKSHLSAANDELFLSRLIPLALRGDEKGYELVKGCDPELIAQMRTYLSTLVCSAADNFHLFPYGECNPTHLTRTRTNSFVNAVVSCILECVNRLGIDLHKAVGMEPDVFKITDLINKNAGRKTTLFVVISGCRQTHDISAITKYLAMEQIPRCDLLIYRDNWPDEFPLDYGEQLFMESRRPELLCTDDIHEEYLCFSEQWDRTLKFLLVLDGVSSIKQLKEIRKLDAVFNDQFPGSIVMLSTDIDTFKEFESYVQSHDSVFLGYVDGAAIADQSVSMENVADSGRPFCLELNALQLGEIIAMADERTAGIPYSIGVMLLNYY